MPTTREMGWKCPITGTVYCAEQVEGYGSPPASPAYQQDNPGTGPGPACTRVAVDVVHDGTRPHPVGYHRGAPVRNVTQVTEAA